MESVSLASAVASSIRRVDGKLYSALLCLIADKNSLGFLYHHASAALIFKSGKPLRGKPFKELFG